MVLLEVSKVDFRYYGSSFGLSDVNLSLSEGESLVIYGRENSGKTTLMRLLCGLEEYVSGDIFLDGIQLKELSQKQMDVGFSFDSRILDGKELARDAISIPMNLRNVSEDVKASYLQAVSERCGISLNTQVKDLSDTRKAMLIIARLFAVDRRLYLVDDVWKDLSQEGKDAVIAYLLERIKGKSVIVSADDSELAKSIAKDKILILSDNQALPTLSVEEIVRRPLNMQSAIFAGYELHTGQLDKSGEEYFANLYGERYSVARPIGDVYVGKRVCFAIKRIGGRCDGEEVGDGEVMSFYYDINNERIITHC